MNFNEWFKNRKFINETTKLIKNYNKNSQIIKLGKFGWWTVWSSTDNRGFIQDQKPVNSDSYEILKNAGFYKYDYMKEPEALEKIRNVFEESAYQLAVLGFPRMHSNVILADLSQHVNHITGGGTGGYANDKEHGFVIDKSNIDIITVVHEHAHMFWHNLPNNNKSYFKTYYNKNIKNNKTILDPYKKILAVSQWNKEIKEDDDIFNVKKLKKVIESNFESFYEKIINLEKIPNAYFEIKSQLEIVENNSLIPLVLLNYHGAKVHCKLKNDIFLTTNSGRRKDFKKGDIIYVAKYSDKFILEYFENSIMYEYPYTISTKDIDKYIEYDYDVLNDYEKELYNNSLYKIKKLEPVKLFAPFKHKEEINKIFIQIGEDIAGQFLYNNDLYLKYSYKDLFNTRNLYYSNWVAVVSRRFKKNLINNKEDFKNVFIEMYSKNILKDFRKTPPENYLHRYVRTDNLKFDSPEFNDLRKNFANAGVVPDEYAAANVGELWAVCVEYAITNKNSISRELKKLIYKTINGV